MGFVTGFTGGVTVTLGLAYLTVLTHERNRQSQALYLRSQTHLLNSLFEPEPPAVPSRAELARQSRSTFTEQAKDRWNTEVESTVRWVHNTDWNGVRDDLEGAATRLLGLGSQKAEESNQEAKNSTPRVQEAVNRSRAAVNSGIEETSMSIDRAAAITIGGAGRASGAINSEVDAVITSTSEKLGGIRESIQNAAAKGRAETSKATREAKSSASHAAEEAQNELPGIGAGTVDAARGAVRSVISKGIEKGKEVIGKAQTAAGLATEKVESASHRNGLRARESEVERALRQRYEKLQPLSKTPEEVLEDRYKSLNKRDNGILRGV